MEQLEKTWPFLGYLQLQVKLASYSSFFFRGDCGIDRDLGISSNRSRVITILPSQASEVEMSLPLPQRMQCPLD